MPKYFRLVFGQSLQLQLISKAKQQKTMAIPTLKRYTQYLKEKWKSMANFNLPRITRQSKRYSSTNTPPATSSVSSSSMQKSSPPTNWWSPASPASFSPCITNRSSKSSSRTYALQRRRP
ncbi:hypothetical protein FGO68_gene8220 [Halteria grandinella]|uniref:Uncharacterized protein n=1 Tax=Halteria grandinella TaxID=5974 RepID=A0A8J8P212_HALGN|nr:hypothetical protein FGO68_gene8220 [Halteria grandinella]